MIFENKKLKRKIEDAYHQYVSDHSKEPYAADVTTVTYFGGKDKRVKIKLDNEGRNDDDNNEYWHVCPIESLLRLCDNGNPEQFMITNFYGFIGDPRVEQYKAWAFIEEKIRQLMVSELIIRPFPDKDNCNCYPVEVLSFKAAIKDTELYEDDDDVECGTDDDNDDEFVYECGPDGINTLPSNLRIFTKLSAIKDIAENDGDALVSEFRTWNDEADAKTCPIILVGDKLFYRSLDIGQQIAKEIPENIQVVKDQKTGSMNLYGWRWNGYKPILDTVCFDDEVLLFDVLNNELNLDEVSDSSVEWYKNADECKRNNKVEVVYFE